MSGELDFHAKRDFQPALDRKADPMPWFKTAPEAFLPRNPKAQALRLSLEGYSHLNTCPVSSPDRLWTSYWLLAGRFASPW